MKKKYIPGTVNVTVDEQDFGTVLICAIRYTMGRQTYMPSLVRDFVRPFLPSLCDKTIEVMIQDCDFQRRNDLYGNEQIDKPKWIEWERELKSEKARRKQIEKVE
ncbi:MAG: hypothetical protein J6S50_09750 [Oscillospiraceae bacterium]|nr:hypothetical protein [Oscillospiraceae bacterium]